MSAPNSLIAPEFGRRSPLIWLNSVVLPAPFGPMISRRSPGLIASETSCVTVRPPNAFFRSMTSSAWFDGGHRDPLRSTAASLLKPGTIPVGITSTMNRNTRPSSMFQRST